MKMSLCDVVNTSLFWERPSRNSRNDRILMKDGKGSFQEVFPRCHSGGPFGGNCNCNTHDPYDVGPSLTKDDSKILLESWGFRFYTNPQDERIAISRHYDTSRMEIHFELMDLYRWLVN